MRGGCTIYIVLGALKLVMAVTNSTLLSSVVVARPICSQRVQAHSPSRLQFPHLFSRYLWWSTNKSAYEECSFAYLSPIYIYISLPVVHTVGWWTIWTLWHLWECRFIPDDRDTHTESTSMMTFNALVMVHPTDEEPVIRPRLNKALLCYSHIYKSKSGEIDLMRV